MKRFWIATVVVLAMLLPALPASAGKPPGTPGKPPPNEVTPQYEVTMEFVPGADGLSTNDTDCGPADSIVMDWDGRNLGAAFEPDGEPYIDVRLGAELAWYRNQVIDRVNGRQVRSLDELIDAIESHDGDYQFFEFSSYRRFGVLDRREAERANAEILERYGVPRDRNP